MYLGIGLISNDSGKTTCSRQSNPIRLLRVEAVGQCLAMDLGVSMMRVITVVSAAREAIRMSRSYGNPDVIYSFPSTAVPPPRSSKKRGSTLAIREAEPPSGKSTLGVCTSLGVLLIAARVCRSCGNPAHMLPDCPVLYYTDTNTDHSCNWADSTVGQAWLSHGEVMW